MRAELAKVRSLPLPRWTLAVELGLVLLATIVVVFAGGSDSDHYATAAQVACGLGTGVGSIVLGVWIVGLEYGQKTVRRALTADPRRGRLAGSKLAAGLLVVEASSVFVWAFATLLVSVVASANGAGSPAGDVLSLGAGFLVVNAIYATVGWGIALLLRSMAGAVTLTLALAYVIGTGLAAIPTVGDYTLGVSAYDAASAVTWKDDLSDGDPEVLRGVLVTAGWIAAFAAAGWLRFTRGDVR